MTFPVTPNPSIHNDVTAQKSNQLALQAEQQALQQMFSDVIPHIVQLIVNKILDALGLSPVEREIDALLNALFNAMTNFPGGHVSGTTADLQSLIDGVVGGSNNPVSSLTNFITALLGIKWFDASTSAGSNLLVSPDFEDTTIPRYYLPGAYSTEQAHSGTHSWKYVHNGAHNWMPLMAGTSPSGDPYNNQNEWIKAKPAQIYLMEAWVYQPATNVTPVSINLYCAARNSITGVSSEVYPNAFSLTSVISGWTKLSGFITVPAGCDILLPSISFDATNATNNVYYIDDVSMHEDTTGQSIIQDLWGVIGNIGSVILAAVVPGLDASKITSGAFAQSMITNLVTDLANLLPWNWFNATKLSGSNLLVNPDFEDTSITINGAGSYSTTVARSGTHSYMMTAPNPGAFQTTWLLAGADNAHNSIHVAPGQKFYEEIWVYSAASNVALGSGAVSLAAYFKDSTGVNADQNITVQAITSITNGSWTKLSGYVTVPTGLDTLLPFIQLNPQVPSGNVYYFDDALVREETAAQNIIEQLWGVIGNIGATILAAVVPGLDATKITSGSFPQSQVTNLVTDLGNRLLTSLFNIRQTSATNLSFSGDYENSTVSRGQSDTANGSYSTTRSHSGTQSWKIVFPGGSSEVDLWMTPNVSDANYKVGPGQKYFASAWIYPETANVGTDVEIYAAFSDSTGVNPTAFGNITPPSYTKGAWNQTSGYLTVPTGYDLMSVKVSVRGDNTANDTFYIDDTVLREETAAQNIIEQLWGAIGNIGATILAAVIPGLDATKITSGIFGLPQIPGLPASQITSGSFAQSQITDLVENITRLFSGKASGTNLIPDPSFENTALDNERNLTSDASFSYDTAQVHTGTRSVKVVYNTADQYPGAALTPTLNTQDHIPVKAGMKYYLSQWTKNAATNTGSGECQLYLECTDSTGVNPTNYPAVNLNIYNITSGAWTKQEGYVTIPTGYDKMRPLFCNVRPGNNTGDTFWFDDVECYEVTEPQNIVAQLWGSVGATLGNILASVVPGLDASKIISGLFPQSQVTGLPSFISGTNLRGSNLVISPDFEDSSVPRTGGTGTVAYSTAQKHGGAQSVSITSSNTNGGNNYINLFGGGYYTPSTWLKVQPGQRYYLEAWVYVPSTNAAAPGINFSMDAQDAATNSTVNAAIIFANGVTANTWTQMSGYATIPAGKDLASAYIQWNGTTAVGDVFYVDDVIVREVTDVTNTNNAIFGTITPQNTLQLPVLPDLTASNLIVDGALTNTNVGRGISTGSGYSTEDKHSGSYSIKLLSDGTNEKHFGLLPLSTNSVWTAATSFKVQPGQRYYIEYWVRGKATNVGGGSGGGIWCYFTNSITGDDANSWNYGADSSGDHNGWSNSAGGFAWMQRSCYVTVPAGYDRWTPYIYQKNNTPSGDAVYIDDIRVEQVGKATETLNDYITQAFSGIETLAGTALTDAKDFMQQLYNSVVQNTHTLNSLQSTTTANNSSGTSVSVNFADYADGPLPSIFTVTYSGSGTSTVGISGGYACWNSKVNDANRQAISIYNVAPTDTDFQIVRGSMGSPPDTASSGGTPKIWALARVDSPSNPQNYVWARGYSPSWLSYQADLGYTVAGVDYVWESAIPLNWSLDMYLQAGVGATAREYQVFSGGRLQTSYSESGTSSMLGSGYRHWGAKNEICTGSSQTASSGTLAGSTTTDNATPAIVGSYCSVYRASTSSSASNGVTGDSPVPANTFDTVRQNSSDITFSNGNTFTVANAGTYLVSFGLLNSAAQINGGNTMAELYYKPSGGSASLFKRGEGWSYVNGGPPWYISGSFLIYLNAGDSVIPGTYSSSFSMTFVGNSTGYETWADIALVNKSMA